MISLREENVKHFDMGNGTFQAVAYGHPVHELDENGQWKDIDFSLSLSQTRGVSAYTNETAGVAFPAAYTPNQPLMTMSGENDSISMTLVTNASSGSVTARSAAAVVTAEVTNPQNSFDTVEAAGNATFSSTIVYEDVLPNVDFEYIVEADGVKENIAVNSRQSKYSYSFRLELNNLIPQIEAGGAVAIYDSVSGELRYGNVIMTYWTACVLNVYCDHKNLEPDAPCTSYKSVHALVTQSRPVIHVMQFNGSDVSNQEALAYMTLILAHEIAHTFGMGEPNLVAGHDDNGGYCVMSKLPGEANGVAQKYNYLLANPQNAFCDSCKQALDGYIANGLYAARDN